MASILHGNAKHAPNPPRTTRLSREPGNVSGALFPQRKDRIEVAHATGIEDKKSGPATRRSALTEVEQQALVRSGGICAYP